MPTRQSAREPHDDPRPHRRRRTPPGPRAGRGTGARCGRNCRSCTWRATAWKRPNASPRCSPNWPFWTSRCPASRGLEVAQGIEGTTRVVFVTAYDEYAVQAFEHEALDYVLKPVQPERLQRTVQRIRAACAWPQPGGRGQRTTAGRAAAAAARAQPASLGQPRTPALGARQQRRHDAPGGRAEVLFFRADDKYTCVRTASAEHLIRTPIAELVASLDPAVFRAGAPLDHRQPAAPGRHAARRGEPALPAHQGPCARAAGEPRLRALFRAM
jgi:DNA-binding LytR/AlgR family response regulator